jgi:hypothetical protein
MRYHDGFMHHSGAGGGLFALLLFLVFVGAIVALIVTLLRTRHVLAPPPPPPPGVRPGGMEDQAIAELRLSYARGQIGRDEFLTRLVDLGGRVDSPPPPPPPA